MSLLPQAPAVRVGDEVRRALAQRRPVVALETAVVTHGLPRPTNLHTARAMMDEVRREGAVPAVVGVLDRRLVVGLQDQQLVQLAEDPAAAKCGPRDLALRIASGAPGGTTVGGTLIGAAVAGVGVFATGGIGGVHRGDALDISADLDALARWPVLVVCSGAKSLLDLPRTMEALETRGVPVLGWRTSQLPAFLVADSGLSLPAQVQSAEEVAAVIVARDDLGRRHAIVLAVPVPEGHGLSHAEVEEAVASAHERAAHEGVSGARLTPFVLRAVAEITEGRSLRANRALLRQNAAVAAQVARALADSDAR